MAVKKAKHLYEIVSTQLKEQWTPVPCRSLLLPLGLNLQQELQKMEDRACCSVSPLEVVCTST